MAKRNITATEWALETLGPEERELVETYYGLGRTPEEIDIDPAILDQFNTARSSAIVDGYTDD